MKCSEIVQCVITSEKMGFLIGRPKMQKQEKERKSERLKMWSEKW